MSVSVGNLCDLHVATLYMWRTVAYNEGGACGDVAAGICGGASADWGGPCNTRSLRPTRHNADGGGQDGLIVVKGSGGSCALPMPCRYVALALLTGAGMEVSGDCGPRRGALLTAGGGWWYAALVVRGLGSADWGLVVICGVWAPARHHSPRRIFLNVP